MATPSPSADESPPFSVDKRASISSRMMQADERAELPVPPDPTPVPTPTTLPEPDEQAEVVIPRVSLAVGEPAGPGEITHVVEEGETLWSIAVANGVKPAELAARNGLPEDALVAAGDELVIPQVSSQEPLP